MQKLTRYHKRIRLTFIAAALLCCFLIMMIFNSASGYAADLDYYVVKISGDAVGSANSREKAEKALADARLRLSREAESIVYVDSKFTIENEKKAFAATDDAEELGGMIYEKLKEYTDLNYVQAIMLSAGGYSVTVDSPDTAERVLQALLDKYDTADEYDVRLNTEISGDFTGITYAVRDSASMEEKINERMTSEGINRSAAAAELHQLKEIGFVDSLEMRSVYTDASAVISSDRAVREVLENGAGIGVVTSGVATYDEDFYAPVEYVYDDTMYEGQNREERAPVPGQRNVTAKIIYVNAEETGRDILEQTVFSEPVSQIIRTGTVTPPMFVQPLSNCSLSSGFGYRWGALHKGNDYSCSYGEPIYASCPGVVLESQFDGSYGNYVLIRHDDHLVTRYAHMSQLACSPGQEVSRYEVIGYAGSTGDSTGNHCHFEIIQDGVALDPFIYLGG